MLDVAAAPFPQRELRWVFLDRDGTLNAKPPEGEYVERPQDLELLPGAARAVAMLNGAGLWTAVVTNQRGVALGRMGAEELDAVHERLRLLLGREGAFLDAIYACPHGLEECDCRKPRPGMLLKARVEHPRLDFARAAIVGDSCNDILAGAQLGLATVLLGDPGTQPPPACAPDATVPDLLRAAELLVADRDDLGGERSAGAG